MVMIVKSKKTSVLVPEGPHIAQLTGVTAKPNDLNPKKAVFRYKVNGREDEVCREVPVSFEERSPLRKDTETLLGRELTSREAEEGVDLGSLAGKPCKVFVTHKTGVGGRPTAVVTLVQPATRSGQVHD